MKLCNILLCTSLLLLCSCVNTITVNLAANQVAVDVYLIDHGRTSSLVISSCPDEGQATRYAFGDWRYYALIERSVWRGAAALLWPTQATLGRQQMPQPSDTSQLGRLTRSWPGSILTIPTNGGAASKLCETLERSWEPAKGDAVYNSESVMYFINIPRPRYHLFYNSNHVSKQWLRELGHEVRGTSVLSDWRLHTKGSPAP